MFIGLQIITVLGMIAATFIVYKAFGTKKSTFIFSVDEKLKWDELISKNIGSWLTLTSIVGTLTSLATVFVFFIGNSKLFGWVIFICVFTILFSFIVTNYFTTKITSTLSFQEHSKKNPYFSAIIASVFWKNDDNSIRTSRVIKYISIVNISSILWLEFSIFADISSKLISKGDLLYTCVILFIIAYLIALFTFKFGLRGFVFGDFFHSPLILLGSIIILIGSIILVFFSSTNYTFNLSDVLTPKLDWASSLAFIVATIGLNLFLVLVSESHWLRVWIFGKKETTVQAKSQISTAIVWFVLISIGLVYGAVGNGALGKDAVSDLLLNISNISPLFAMAFWIAGTAALFSTADTQLFSLFMVSSYNPKDANIHYDNLNKYNPFLISLFIALSFTIIYFIVDLLKLPFEKLVFLLLPIGMNAVPAFFREYKNYKQYSRFIYFSIILYAACSIKALVDPSDEFFFTVAAPITPFVAGLFALLLKKEKYEVNNG